jgi:L-lactate dehydrogenase complex protein LldE
MGEKKITNAIETNAEYIISTDMRCLMHIDGCLKNHGASMKVMHLVDILACGY